MHDSIVFARSLFVVAITSAFAVSGCAHRAPALIRDGMTVISGYNTARANASEATQTVLVEAAAITIDHGYRYFQVLTRIRPGVDVTVHLYGKGEIDPHAPGVYDANDIAAGKMR